VLVGVFGMPAQLDTGTLTVDGGGLFLHGSKVKRNPDYLRGRGRAEGTPLGDATATDRGHPSPISQRYKGKKNPRSVHR
jgi:hypothetical protein